jgi:hypothetical protein
MVFRLGLVCNSTEAHCRSRLPSVNATLRPRRTATASLGRSMIER